MNGSVMKNLVPTLSVNTGDGPDSDANYAILNRGKRHDYFTSCLAWPQKGSAVSLPLGTQAPAKIVPGTAGGRMVNSSGSPIPAGSLSTIAGGFLLVLVLPVFLSVMIRLALFLLICLLLRRQLLMLYVLLFKFRNC